MKFLPLFMLSVSVFASGTVLNFDTTQLKVNWRLNTVLHTVHGTFQFKSGTIRFDAATGKARGALVVDARSGESGNGSRDQRMHKSIIESTKFTEILFTPDQVQGRVPESGTGLLQIHGIFTLHGAQHEVTMPVQVKVDAGVIAVSLSFKIPYVSWGLKNPSTFLLRVDDNVDIAFQSVGRISH